jgi:hypothetical protein
MDQQSMVVHQIDVATVRVGVRKRPLDPKVVADLAQSIERQGLFQPIGVRDLAEEEETETETEAQARDGVVQLVFGAHRLAAHGHLGRQTIDAYILAPGLTDEEYLLIELQENSARKDLSGAQRKVYAGEIGQLLEKIAQQRNEETFQKNWLAALSKTTGILERTLLNWWHSFCDERGLAFTPKHALGRHQQDFFAWLEAQQQQAEAEKARRDAAFRAKVQQDTLAEAHEYLRELIETYGKDTIWTEVLEPFYGAMPRDTAKASR